jgi:uncharacterized protein (DUF885 family)
VPVPPADVSLAVLPFADMSAAHDQEAFSDGLSEEILNQLRITAQLINAKVGSHRWSQTYASELKDIFTVQEEIAKDVAQALSIKLDVGDMSRAGGGTTNLEAYDRFLRGQIAFERLCLDVHEAVPLLREATALDLAGRADDAQAEYERSKALAGTKFNSDFLSIMRLMHRPNTTPIEVRSAYRSFAAKYPEIRQASWLNDALGDPQGSRAAVQQGLVDPASQHPRLLASAAVFADYVGDKDTALAAMQRFSAATSAAPLTLDGLGFLWSPFKTNLRTDPRFKDIVRGLGLVDYWRASGNWGDFCKPLGTDDFECH